MQLKVLTVELMAFVIGLAVIIQMCKLLICYHVSQVCYTVTKRGMWYCGINGTIIGMQNALYILQYCQIVM